MTSLSLITKPGIHLNVNVDVFSAEIDFYVTKIHSFHVLLKHQVILLIENTLLS